MNTPITHTWQDYCTEELGRVTPLLHDEGFLLETEQPHLLGERSLLSGPKLVLYGARIEDSLRVVIKITRDSKEARKLEEEHEILGTVQTLPFAYRACKAPEVLLFGKKDAYTFLILRYIEQELPFLSRPLEDQFFFALKGLEMQEAHHVTTHEHLKALKGRVEVVTPQEYLSALERIEARSKALPTHAKRAKLFSQARELLAAHLPLLARYGNFLTHWDFVPHNIRIYRNELYLLDHTSLRLGNKYEGWARFLNFMTLHNPELEGCLVRYIRDNRFPDESVTLRVLRIYRASELVWFYLEKLGHTEGDLHTLTEARVTFWSEVLLALCEDRPLENNIRTHYQNTRDRLRDTDEKKRQETLH